MRLFLLGLVFCVQSFAWQAHFFVAAASTNIPAAFDTSAQSRVMTSLVEPTVLTICNETAVRLCVNNQTYDGTTPATVTHRIPAGQCFSTGVRYAPVVFINGCGTLIAVGFVHGFAD